MNLTTPSLKPVALAACIILAAPAAFSQAFDAVRLYGAAPGQDGGTLGLAVIAGTEYQGANERRTLVLPVLDYQWSSGWFAGVTNGVGYNFGGHSKAQYGLRVTADLGRKQSRSDALRGLGDIEPAAEVGVFFNYLLPLDFFVTSSLRYGSGNDERGVLLDVGSGYSLALSPRWRVGLGAALTVANAEYMQSYFGVTSAQAASSGYRTYTPSAGVRDVRANVAVTYQFHQHLSLTTGLSVSTLGSEAKDSPLTRKSSSASSLFALAWAF
jgi:MipA family protein